jgi:hypothetical protein
MNSSKSGPGNSHFKIILNSWCVNIPKTMKINAILLMAIVVFGILLAGCTQSSGTSPVTTAAPVPSPSPTEAVTAVTTTQQIMNETVPVPSVRIPVTILSGSNETGINESTNVNNNATTPVSVANETFGGLFINVQRGGSVDGLKVFIAREGTDLSQIEYSFLPDRTVVEGENRGYLQVKVPPDGRSELIRLQTGNYTAYIPTMGGGEMEHQSFTVREEVIITVYLMGFSAAGGGGCGC